MAQQIQFVYLAQSEYDALTKQGNVLYFTSDTHRIYRGTDLYATTSFDTVSAQSATFGDLTVTGNVSMSLSQVEFGSIEASEITVDGSSVSLEGHTHSFADIDGLPSHVSQVTASISSFNDQLQGITQTEISKSTATFGDLTITGELTCSLDQVQFGSILASEITVNGSSVSLEGHTHSTSDISGLDQMLSGYASASHSHAISDIASLSTILEGITQSEVSKSRVSASAGVFDQISAESATFSSITVQVADFTTTRVSAQAMTVGGSNVSVEGHTHEMSEISGLVEAMASSMESAVGKSALASAVSGLSLASDATQKTIRETLASLISALQSVAGVVCMAFMTMFGAMDAGALSLDTNWEDVNPTNTMMDVAGVVNDQRLTIAQYTDGSTLAFSNLTSVGQNTFPNKTSLKYVRLGNMITNVENYAFSQCPNITRIVFSDMASEEVKAIPNYPWGLTNGKVICGKDVDEESGANGKYPLFVIDLNPGNERTWTGLELKASTNNFVSVGAPTVSILFYTATTANGMTIGTGNYDWCRLYILSRRSDSDIKKWKRITNTFDLNGYAPLSLAIIVDPDLFKRGQDASWLEEKNPELIWSYTKVGLDSSEQDQDGQNVWRPVMPVKWYKELPEWANQNASTPDGSNVTTYTNMQMRISILEEQLKDLNNTLYTNIQERISILEEQLRGLNNALHVINTGNNL